MVLRVQIFGHDPDELRVAVGLEFSGVEVFGVVFVIHGEGVEFPALPGLLPGCDRGDEAGIQPTREEGTDGYVRDQLPPDGVAHQCADLLQGLGQGILVLPVLQSPIPAQAHVLPVKVTTTSWLHLPDSPEDAATRRPARSQKHDLCHTLSVHLGGDRRMGQKRFQLRGE